jgi:hypothetical protein
MQVTPYPRFMPSPVRASDDRRRTSDEWLAALGGAGGVEYEQAVNHLHRLLLRAARSELARRRAALSHVRGEELEDLAMQAADDALVAVLHKLDSYRGASRFTTWAYRFALLEAGVPATAARVAGQRGSARLRFALRQAGTGSVRDRRPIG